MQPETDAPMRLQSGGEKFQSRVINPLMFRAYMLAKMPVLGITGTYLSDIDTRRSVAVVPFGWSTKNLFGRFFDSAVVAAAETASLSLLVLHVRNQGAELTANLSNLDVDVHRSPSEELYVRCEEGHRYADFVRRARAEAPMEQTVRAVVETASGERTHEVELRWRLQKK